MQSNRELFNFCHQYVYSELTRSGYEVDLSNSSRLTFSVGDNGCVNFCVEVEGTNRYTNMVRLIEFEMKYDAKPENSDKSPSVIMYILRVDGGEFSSYTNPDYD